MSTSQEREDDRQRWEHEVGSEPQWVKDMCCLPWVVMVQRNGDIQIIDNDNVVVCTMQNGNKEIAATIASVICEHVNAL
jgi:hypothetical protein